MKKKVIAILILIIGITILIIYLNNRVVDDNSGFTLKENLKTEIYTKANINDYIKNIEGKIIEKPQINTKKLGKQEISFIYLNKDNKKRRGTIEIEIVDTEKPLVWLSNNYNPFKNYETDRYFSSWADPNAYNSSFLLGTIFNIKEMYKNPELQVFHCY